MCLVSRRSRPSRLSRLPRLVGNSGSSDSAGAFGEPDAQDRDGDLGERRDAVLAAFAAAADVRPGCEVHVAAVQAGQLGGAQPGLDRGQQQRVVASAGPGRAVGSVEQRVDLGSSRKVTSARSAALGRDREHALDVLGVFGVAERGVSEQRVDRRQAGVAGADAVAALVLEVVEERGDQRRVEVADVELAGLAAELRGGERRAAA